MEKDRKLAYEATLFTLFVALLLLWALRTAEGWHELRASIVIFFLGGIGLLLTVFQLIVDIKSTHRTVQEEKRGISFDVPPIEASSRWGTVQIWAWLLGFYGAIRLVGFTSAVPLFVFSYAKTYGASWSLAFLLAAGAWGFLYSVFQQILHVAWPEPILWFIVYGDS